jgi:hypothetical protein
VWHIKRRVLISGYVDCVVSNCDQHHHQEGSFWMIRWVERSGFNQLLACLLTILIAIVDIIRSLSPTNAVISRDGATH